MPASYATPSTIDTLVPSQRAEPPRPNAAPPHDVDELVRTHLPLVRQVLFQVSARFPRHADREDLAQAGAVGLVEAARRFDPARGVPFERWAALRIRGAILDAVRATDFAPRSLRGAMREVDETRAAIAAEAGRRPTDTEVADRVGLTVRELASLTARAHDAFVVSLDAPASGDEDGGSLADRVAGGPENEPTWVLERRELAAYVRASLDLLPDDRRRVVAGYFLDGRTSAELAHEMGVTESRISQLRTEALLRMRTGIEAQYGTKPPAGVRPTRADRRAAAYATAIAERARS